MKISMEWTIKPYVFLHRLCIYERRRSTNVLSHHQKKPLKAKVTNLLRRASTSAAEMKRTNGHSTWGSKVDMGFRLRVERYR